MATSENKVNNLSLKEYLKKKKEQKAEKAMQSKEKKWAKCAARHQEILDRFDQKTPTTNKGNAAVSQTNNLDSKIIEKRLNIFTINPKGNPWQVQYDLDSNDSDGDLKGAVGGVKVEKNESDDGEKDNNLAKSKTPSLSSSSKENASKKEKAQKFEAPIPETVTLSRLKEISKNGLVKISMKDTWREVYSDGEKKEKVLFNEMKGFYVLCDRVNEDEEEAEEVIGEEVIGEEVIGEEEIGEEEMPVPNLLSLSKPDVVPETKNAWN